ncbi:VOC family protein [soil metagenome]
MTDPVVHFEVVGRDGAALQSFYTQMFGWQIDANNPMQYGVVPPSEGGIGGGIAQSDSPALTFYVQVDDPQTYLDRAEALGGRTVMPVTSIPGTVTFAQIADPEGNVVGVVAAENPPAG